MIRFVLTDGRPVYKQIISGVLLVPVVLSLVMCGFLFIGLIAALATAAIDSPDVFVKMLARMAITVGGGAVWLFTYIWAIDGGGE